MSKVVKIKVTDLEGVALPIQFLVVGTIAIFGVVLFVPFIVWLEVRAWLVRQRLRKERLTG